MLVTTVTSGTGFILALTVASKGGDILMLNRTSDRSTAAFKRINEYIADIKSDSKCYQIPCDLQDFASVREAAVKVTEQFPGGIDVLCNNAGVMYLPDKATKDGYGMTVSDAYALLCTCWSELAGRNIWSHCDDQCASSHTHIRRPNANEPLESFPADKRTFPVTEPKS